MADSKNRKLSNAYLPSAGDHKLKKERYEYLDSSEIISLIDSDYVQDRQLLRDSSFVSGIVDSNYVNTLLSGGPGNIEILTSSGSVTTTKGGNILVYIAGGGGGGVDIFQGGRWRGGNSGGEVLMTNVAPGATLNATLGTGAASFNANGGTCTLTDGTTTITCTGGGPANSQAGNRGTPGVCSISPYPGNAKHIRTLEIGSNEASNSIGEFGLGGHQTVGDGVVVPSAQGYNNSNTGTNGVVILVGV